MNWQSKIFALKVDDYKTAYFANTDDQTIEKMMSRECKAGFVKHHSEIQVPHGYDAMRSVVVKNIEKQISEFSEEDTKASIEKIIYVIKIPDVSFIIKVRFEKIETNLMAKRAIEN